MIIWPGLSELYFCLKKSECFKGNCNKLKLKNIYFTVNNIILTVLIM